MKQKDLVGKRFGYWVIRRKVKDVQRRDYKEGIWECVCDCGTVRELRSRALLHKTNGSRSCGCLRAETQRARPSRLSHGLSKTHWLYPIWKTMRMRCNNPNSRKYPSYGARGIKVCERWNSFKNFADDMAGTWKRGLTLDRKDNDKGYSPDNCRWAHPIIQANNTRKRKVALVIVNACGYDAEALKHWKQRGKVMKDLLEELALVADNIDHLTFYKLLADGSAAFKLEEEDEAIFETD